MFQQQWFPVASYEKFTKSLGWFHPEECSEKKTFPKIPGN